MPRATWTPKNRLIGMFDVLGFKSLLEDIGIAALGERIHELCNKLDEFFRWETRAVVFSDTIILYSRELHDDLGKYQEMEGHAFFGACALLQAEALAVGLPLRAGIACGPCVAVPSRGVFLGSPVIDAYLTAESQDWIGVALHPTCGLAMPRDLWPVVVPWDIPLKRFGPTPGFTLDWPRQAAQVWGMADLGQFIRQQVAAHLGSPHEHRWHRTLEFYETRAVIPIPVVKGLGPNGIVWEDDYASESGFSTP